MHFRIPSWTLTHGLDVQSVTNKLGARLSLSGDSHCRPLTISSPPRHASYAARAWPLRVWALASRELGYGLSPLASSSPCVFRVARLYCGEDGVCPVCGARFPTRSRCMHHIHQSTSACLQALLDGRIPPLDGASVQALDKADALSRKMALRNGLSFLVLGANT